MTNETEKTFALSLNDVADGHTFDHIDEYLLARGFTQREIDSATHWEVTFKYTPTEDNND